MTPETAAALREPFPPEAIGKLPRAGIELDFVGHALVTSRLLSVDPEWTWEPMAFDEDGLPKVARRGNDAVLWIRLTVAGVTRLGVGTAKVEAFELDKQLISDALRNAAMRFGVALDLWTRQEIHDAPLPPVEPVATKDDVDDFKALLDCVSDEERMEFITWKNTKGFEWPWTVAALDAMKSKLTEIVGAEGGSQADPPTEQEGSPGAPDLQPPSASDVPEELLAFSDEAFEGEA